MRSIQIGFVAVAMAATVGCWDRPSKSVRTSPQTILPTTSPARTIELSAVDKIESKPTEIEPPVSIVEPIEVKPSEIEEKEPDPESPPPMPKGAVPLNKLKTLWLELPKESGSRKVHILAEVCLREGPLELFLCKVRSKEHESILAADFDARELHFALMTIGAKAGTPVQFFDRKTNKELFKPASGSKIGITLTYNLGGKPMTAMAQEWIRDARTKQEMSHEWVFAGSRLFKNPDDPTGPEYYCANNGEVICISNFIDAMLDLPVKSPRESAALAFESNPKKIPSRGTKVLVTLEVIPPK